MGWYSAIGRPLFFALPPETAHRIAGAMLGSPLPWGRIGHAVDDPSLRTTATGKPVSNETAATSNVAAPSGAARWSVPGGNSDVIS